jgi:hypothetical protein
VAENGSEASTAGGAALHSVAAYKAAAGAAIAEYFASGQVDAIPCTTSA